MLKIRYTPITALVARFTPKKIRTKLFVGVTLLIGIICLFIFIYFPKRIEGQALKAVSIKARNISEMTALSLSSALHFKDDKVLGDVFQEAREIKDLAYLVVVNGNGTIAGSLNRTGANTAELIKEPGAKPVSPDGSMFRASAPIIYKESNIGNVFLGLSLKQIRADFGRNRRVVGLISLLIFIIGVGATFGLSTLVTLPLSQMTKTAEWIARGDLKHRAEINSHDEVGILARSFNSMVDNLEGSRRKLEEFNRVLEQKVAARAQDLEREISDRRRIEKELRLVREELEHRVVKRTEELAMTNEELEKRVLDTKRTEDQLQNTLQKLQKALEGTVKAMSLTIEMRDLYTAGHQRRVMNLAVAIAKEMSLPQDKIDGIGVAGVIHDIGKIAMPAEILAKPTRLTKTEFLLVRDHPRIGYDILKTIEFPWPVAHIVLQHHERMDGSGYPDGLIGDAILLEARILAVADHVEAMSSHRPYRPALGLEKALEEIRKGRGVQFDASVVDACFMLFKEKRYRLETSSLGPGY